MNEISLEDILADEKEAVQTLDKTTKRAGRPKQTDERADQRVTLYFTKSQLERVEKFCFNEKIKVGTFIKDLFFKEFDKEELVQKDEILNIEKYLNEQDPKKLGELVLDFLQPKK